MATKLKQSDLKAIAWFCDKNNLRPSMSIPPFQMNFTSKTTGLDTTCHLDFITLQYKEHSAEESKRRKREKNEDKSR